MIEGSGTYGMWGWGTSQRGGIEGGAQTERGDPKKGPGWGDGGTAPLQKERGFV